MFMSFLFSLRVFYMHLSKLASNSCLRYLSLAMANLLQSDLAQTQREIPEERRRQILGLRIVFKKNIVCENENTLHGTNTSLTIELSL